MSFRSTGALVPLESVLTYACTLLLTERMKLTGDVSVKKFAVLACISANHSAF